MLRRPLIGLLVAILSGCASRLPPTPAPHAGHLEAFVLAHQDDWQLFMGDVAWQAIRTGSRTVFVYTTSGDAGRPAPFWEAREKGALASVAVALGVAPPDTAGEVGGGRFRVECADSMFSGHAVRRCQLGTSVSYFLRLPDGNLNGQGFPATGGRSLMQLANGIAAPVPTLDGKGSFRSWQDLVDVVGAVLKVEASAARASGAQVQIHATDPDTAFNPRDHADHRATGRLAAAIANANEWTLLRYAGYSTAEWPTNLSADQFAEKTALFMAYDRARVLASPEWSAYAELPRYYSAWLSRTYTRPTGFTGRSR